MAADERWYFTREQLANTPSRKCGIDGDKELSYRQQAANFIQDMGQRLVVSQLCINTAIVYMHRFYVFHSLTQFHRNAIAVAALFLAAKVEEQPRKLEHVIKMAYMCLHREQPPPDSRSEQFLEQAQDLVFNENVLLQTLGFDVGIDHPHTHVVRCCQLVKASKDLAQTSYFMASNSLHLTTMCLQYKPTVVACFCIHLACKWSNWEIPQSTEGRQWFWYVDRSVSADLLKELTEEFLHIFDKCPSRLKRKIMSISANQSPSIHHSSLPNSPFDAEPRKVLSPLPMDAILLPHSSRSHHAVDSTAAAHSSRSHHSADGTASASVAAAAAHSSRSHHVTNGATASAAHSRRSHHTTDAVAAHSSRSHHTTDAATVHSSRSHHTTDGAVATIAHSSRSHHAVDSTAAAHSSRSHHSADGTASASVAAATAHSSRSHHVTDGATASAAHSSRSHHTTDAVAAHSSRSHHTTDAATVHSSRSHHTTDGAVAAITHSSRSHHTQQQEKQDEKTIAGPSTSRTIAGPSTSRTAFDIREYREKKDRERLEREKVAAAAAAACHIVDPNKPQAAWPNKPKRLYRGEDPRLKSAKYPDMSRIEIQRRKTETLEQRCEEVRKLIEKPLPPPKQADMPYLINAQQKQQTHHSKYNQQQQQDKLQSGSFSGDAKHAVTAVPNALSPSASSSMSASSSQKSAPVKTQIYNQHITQGVSQILKDTIKNGNSQSCLNTLNNVDDSKSEKRSRATAHDDTVERNSADVQLNSHLHTPPSKHRSLFSPETPVAPRESHVQSARPKSKQKTPPASAITKIKERVSPFASSPTLQDSILGKRPSSIDGAAPVHKRSRTSSIGENEQSVRIKTEVKPEDTSSLEAMKMLGRVPDLIQPIRDNPSSSNRSGSASSVINDLKPPDLIKPFESDPPRFNAMSQHKSSLVNAHALTNGMDLNVAKQDLPEHRAKRELLEHYIKKDQSAYRVSESSHSHLQSKPEYSSPIKSAQSISALLQEPLAPMPSLLQGLQQHNQIPSQQIHQEQLQQQHQQQSVHYSLIDHQLPVTTQCLSVPTTSDNFTPIASTVDISVLSENVSMTLPSSTMAEVAAPSISGSVPTIAVVPPTEEKRSEHHKSEKKKKKEKHKHKDKEKSKEKHKHKHKDKDKERHREKKDKDRSEETSAAAPIKITIPKDKLNLSAETSPISGVGSSDRNISPQSTGLKIKIPKERLKGTDSVPSSSPAQLPVVQGPLKIKIRTDLGISRSASTQSSSTSSSNGSSGTSHAPPSESSVSETTNRKREATGDGSSSKKQMLTIPATYGQIHRPGERQNGRHYNSGSNNKVRGRGGRQHHGGRGPPPHHAVAGQRDSNAGGHYQRDNYGNGRGGHGHQHHQAPYHSHQSHHPSTVRGDVSGYARAPGDQAAESYFYANYQSMFNAPAGYMYDPTYQQYYQQFQQSQYTMYPAGNGLIMTPDGAINTSVPPPSLLPNHLYQNQNMMIQQSAVSARQGDTQLLPPPPLEPPPSPPPLPSGPPPPPPPPPPASAPE